METLESVQETGKQRLRPALTDPNWLILRQRRKLFQAWIEQIEGQDLEVLDVGGRIQPYRPLLGARVRRYIALDLRKGPLVNIIARGEQMPLSTAQFDLVICSQVLEYARDPGLLVAEIHRVLKPGGHLLLSAPSIFPYDSDQDLWRFTPGSLCMLLHLFEKKSVLSEGNSISGLSRTICLSVMMFARPRIIRRVFQLTIVPVLNLTAIFLEPILGKSNDQFAANLSAFAER